MFLLCLKFSRIEVEASYKIIEAFIILHEQRGVFPLPPADGSIVPTRACFGAMLQGQLRFCSHLCSSLTLLRPLNRTGPQSQELLVEDSTHNDGRQSLYLRIWLYLAKRSDRQGAPVLIWRRKDRSCLLTVGLQSWETFWARGVCYSEKTIS